MTVRSVLLPGCVLFSLAFAGCGDSEQPKPTSAAVKPSLATPQANVKRPASAPPLVKKKDGKITDYQGPKVSADPGKSRPGTYASRPAARKAPARLVGSRELPAKIKAVGKKTKLGELTVYRSAKQGVCAEAYEQQYCGLFALVRGGVGALARPTADRQGRAVLFVLASAGAQVNAPLIGGGRLQGTVRATPALRALLPGMTSPGLVVLHAAKPASVASVRVTRGKTVLYELKKTAATAAIPRGKRVLPKIVAPNVPKDLPTPAQINPANQASKGR